MRIILRRFAWALVLSVLGNPASACADAVDDRFAVAADHYRQQRWKAACDELAKLLEEHPDHPRALGARFFYGEALSQLGRWEQARAQFEQLLKRDPNHRYARPALFRGGETAYLGGDDKAAKRELEAFRQRFPKDELNAYALPYLAHLELRADHAAGAQKLFADALEQFPDGPLVDECRLGLAQVQQKTGHLDEARRGYALVADANGPLADQATLQLGMLENTRDDPRSALAALERLAANFPDSPLDAEGRLGRGYALYKLGRYDEAETLLRGLLDQGGLSVEAHYWLGLSQKARGAWRKAAATLLAGTKIEEQHRLSPAMGFHAADALLRDGQLDAAREGFDRVLTHWPHGPWADDCLLGKLRVAAEQQRYADCVQLADELTAKFPGSALLPQGELAKGQSLLALGKYAEAIDPLEQVLARQGPPQEKLTVDARSDARSALTLCYARLGRFDVAEKNLTALRQQQARQELVAETSYQVAEMAYAAAQAKLARELFLTLADGQNSPEMICRGLSGLAWCHFNAGQWTEAAAACDRLLTQDPKSTLAPDAALLRGRALEHLDQNEAALAMYRLVSERYAGSQRAAEALWRAARLHDTLHQNAQAIELYDKLVRGHSDFPELDAAMYRWACLLHESGQAAAAGELFERLPREFPQSRYAADATLRLAERALSAQKYDEAQKLLAQITDTGAPATGQQALYLRGRVALAAGQWRAAEAPLAQLIENFPQGELALAAAYLLAEAAYHQGHFEQASQQLADLAARTAGRDEPWSAMAELRRAQSLAQMKEWGQALEVAQTIATRFPNFDQQHEVDYLIGRSLAAAADFSGARAAYSRVIQSEQGSKTQAAAMAQWMIGESYFHQENYTQALAEYAKLDQRYPFARWQAAALLQGGKCHELLGQWRSAVEVYDRLSKNYPTSEFIDEAARRSAAAQQRASGGVGRLK